MLPVTIPLSPACSESSASLALTTPAIVPLAPAESHSAASLAVTVPTTIPLAPAVSRSSASLALWTPVARALQALRLIPKQATAEIHPHDWRMPESALDAPLLLMAAALAVLLRALRRLR